MTGERLRYILSIGERVKKGEHRADLAAEFGESNSFVEVCAECYRGFQVLSRQNPDFAEKALSGEVCLRMSKLRKFKGEDASEVLVLNAISEDRLMRHFEIKEFVDKCGVEAAKEKFDIPDWKIPEAIYVCNGFQKLSSVIPDLAEQLKCKTIRLTVDSCRAVNTYSDDALADAANALLSGGSVSRESGIKWPDGRVRPAKDCKREKNQPKKKAEPSRVPKTSSEELAELIAGAAGTFSASIERYVSDYPDASKEEAVRELQKAEEILAAWIEKLTLNE